MVGFMVPGLSKQGKSFIILWIAFFDYVFNVAANQMIFVEHLCKDHQLFHPDPSQVKLQTQPCLYPFLCDMQWFFHLPQRLKLGRN